MKEVYILFSAEPYEAPMVEAVYETKIGAEEALMYHDNFRDEVDEHFWIEPHKVVKRGDKE